MAVYQSKGDVFTRNLSPKPCLTADGRRADGSAFCRRVRTNEATARLTAGEVIRAARKQGISLDGLTMYARLKEKTLSDEPPGQFVTFTSTKQYHGQRWWLVCPSCGARRGKLYGFVVSGAEILGCRECLGLTWPARARNCYPDRDDYVASSPSCSEWSR